MQFRYKLRPTSGARSITPRPVSWETSCWAVKFSYSQYAKCQYERQICCMLGHWLFCLMFVGTDYALVWLSVPDTWPHSRQQQQQQQPVSHAPSRLPTFPQQVSFPLQVNGSVILALRGNQTRNNNSLAWVCQRTMPTELLVGEVSSNVCT
jgi:hypothetical protein